MNDIGMQGLELQLMGVMSITTWLNATYILYKATFAMDKVHLLAVKMASMLFSEVYMVMQIYILMNSEKHATIVKTVLLHGTM